MNNKNEIKADIIDYVACSRCGKQVSNKVGVELVVRAWVECPECVIKEDVKPYPFFGKEHPKPLK
jgi:DNA-directed RNA polymerase subunit RPC12/RpoP